jgi:hypothetical protein
MSLPREMRFDEKDKEQRLYTVLQDVRDATRKPTFTGTASIEFDVKQGGITTIRKSIGEID